MRSFWAVALLVVVPLVGCGGGGGGGISTPRTTNVKFSLSWGARSRVIAGPSSALSATVTLTGANPAGGDYTAEVDRHADPAAYTQDYNPGTASKVGTFPLTVKFYDQAGGTGNVVAIGNATVTISTAGDGIGTVTTVNTVKSVVVNAGQSLTTGTTKQLTFSARDEANSTVAVSPGSASWSVVTGADVLTVTNDGIASGVKPGTATVRATVDGVASAAAPVNVNNDPDGDNIVVNFDDLPAGVSSLADTPVIASARLGTGYRNSFGVAFTSNAGYVAVVNLQTTGTAPSNPNGITAATAGGLVEYDPTNPIVINFTDPLNSLTPGVTKSVSVTADLDGQPINQGTMQAFDVDGNKIGEVNVTDNGGEVFTISFPTAKIHQVRFLGAPLHNASGIGIDNVTFGPVVPAS